MLRAQPVEVKVYVNSSIEAGRARAFKIAGKSRATRVVLL